MSLITIVTMLTVAALLLVGSPRSDRLRVTLEKTTGPPRHRMVVAAVAVGVAALALALAGEVVTRWLAFIIAGGEVAATTTWLIVRGAIARRTADNERQAIKACSIIAGQLDIGEIPAQALVIAADDLPLLAPAAGAVQMGGSVTGELKRLAQQPGCAGLGQIARGWSLCERTGMPLGPVVRQVASALRQSQDVRDQRRAELASSRSTSRLLAALPVVGIGMGFLVNANPLAYLTGSMAGHLCLIGAATLACAGLIWTEALTKEES